MYQTEEEWMEHMDECYEDLPYGAEKTPNTTAAPISSTSRFRQRYDDPVYLMNAAECELMIAEAYARAGNVAQAKEYYDKAVVAGFERWGLDATEFVDGVYAFDESDMLYSIGMQYWITYADANSFDVLTHLQIMSSKGGCVYSHPLFLPTSFASCWLAVITPNYSCSARNPSVLSSEYA